MDEKKVNDALQKAGNDLVKNLILQPLQAATQRIKQIESQYGRDTIIAVLGKEDDLKAIENGITNIINSFQPTK